jgi:predicted exporter
VLTTKGLLLAGSWAAITFALLALSGFTASSTSQILLASGAVIALVLTRSSRRD